MPNANHNAPALGPGQGFAGSIPGQVAFALNPDGSTDVISWANNPSLYNPTTGNTVPNFLYQWGPITFCVAMNYLNVHEVDHETSTDWAKKEIAGAAIYREWVGENDETIHLRGMMFPYRIGGFAQMQTFETMRRAGIVQMLMRGDGNVLGWFMCEHLSRQHTYLSGEGVGQVINFEASFARAPVPAADNSFSQMWQTTGAGG